MIHPTAVIGQPPEARDCRRSGFDGIPPFIAPTATIGAFVTIDAGVERATFIGAGTWLMKHVHVGHDAVIRADCELAPGTVIGGHAVLGARVKCGIGALVLPRRVIGAGARIGAGAVVTRDVPAGETWVGNPARPLVKPQFTGEVLTPAEEEGWEEIAAQAGVEPEWITWWKESRQ